MKTVAIKGEKRAETGKKATRDLRKQDMVPCIMYSGEHNLSFAADPREFQDLIYSPEFKLAEIELDGQKHSCVLQDIQFHPVTDRIEHIDFLKLVEGRTVKVDVPVLFEGTAEGVKTGGKLYRKKRKVRIKVLAKDLVDKLVVDVSELLMGQAVRVRDIEAPEGVEILTEAGTPLAAVEIPRALRALPEEEEELLEEGEEEAVEETEETAETE